MTFQHPPRETKYDSEYRPVFVAFSGYRMGGKDGTDLVSTWVDVDAEGIPTKGPTPGLENPSEAQKVYIFERARERHYSTKRGKDTLTGNARIRIGEVFSILASDTNRVYIGAASGTGPKHVGFLKEPDVILKGWQAKSDAAKTLVLTEKRIEESRENAPLSAAVGTLRAAKGRCRTNAEHIAFTAWLLGQLS